MPALTYKVLDIITDALIEIGSLAPGEQPPGDEAQWAFRKFNDLCDTWQALEAYVYGYNFVVYTLVANLAPHTIGPLASVPAPTFSTGIQPRPVRLESAALLLNESPGEVDLPMNLRDHDWWAAQQVKQIETNVPTDVYYNPLNPLGELNFWPVPNVARQVRLQFWQTVSQFEAITDPIGGPGGPGTLPQGYRNALKLTLAEDLLDGSNRATPPNLARKALMARAAIFGNNAKSPRMRTSDSGMPKSGKTGVRGDFNWQSGAVSGGPPQ